MFLAHGLRQVARNGARSRLFLAGDTGGVDSRQRDGPLKLLDFNEYSDPIHAMFSNGAELLRSRRAVRGARSVISHARESFEGYCRDWRLAPGALSHRRASAAYAAASSPMSTRIEVTAGAAAASAFCGDMRRDGL